MKKITIHGFYGAKNIGDEAILAAMLNALKSEIPDAQFTVLSIDPAYTTELFNVLSVYRGYRKEVKEKLRTFINTDLFISGGGGLLQDTYPTGIISGPLPHYLLYALVAKLFGKKVMFYAQGMGPITTPYGKFLTKLIANRVDLITVRDEGSKELLQKLGVTKPKTLVTADPVLAITPPQEEVILSIQKKYNINSSENWVGISVRPWFKLEDYKEKIATTCDYIVEEAKAKILFIPMEHEHDYKVSLEIQEKMQHSNHATIMDANHNVEEYLCAVSLMDIVVGMRLHSLIFAAASNVPVVGIIYDPKVKSLLQRISMENYSVDVENFTETELKNKFIQAWENRQVLKLRITEKVAPLKKQALENAKFAADLLRK